MSFFTNLINNVFFNTIKELIYTTNEENNEEVDNNLTLYVLELDNNKYYVGTMINLQNKMDELSSGLGSEWTNIYKPKKFIETICYVNKNCEDIFVKKYMKLFGVDNVRGGSYNEVFLDDDTKNSLEDEIIEEII